MYAEASGLVLPFLHGFVPSELGLGAAVGQCPFPLPLPDEDLIASFNACLSCDPPHMGSMLQSSSVSEYDLGGEGDLFKAPEPIIEEPLLEVDPVAAAMSLISSGDDIVAETIQAVEMESIQNDNLLSEVFYNCRNEFFANSAIADSSCELSDIKISAVQTDGERSVAQDFRLTTEGPIQKSISAGCLSSMDWMNGCVAKPNFLKFQEVDLAAFGMRRAYSEGDIQTLRSNNSSIGNTNMVRASREHQVAISEFKSEERKEKLSRYMKKKTKRNFGRKIKYACRKALADSQPRVRGRFAKTEECEVPKPH